MVGNGEEAQARAAETSMLTGTPELLQDHAEEGVGGVPEAKLAMTTNDAGPTFGEYAQPKIQEYNVPFEVVDDDEMAAIEIALLQAHSVSTAYHSAASRFTQKAFVLPDTISGLSRDAFSSVRTQSLRSKKFENTFVYTVISDSLSNLPSAANRNVEDGSQSSTMALATNSRVRQDSASSAFEDVNSSQSSVDYEGKPEVGEETLSKTNLLPLGSTRDEPSSAFVASVRDISQVSTSTNVMSLDHLSDISETSLFEMESTVQKKIPENSQDMEDIFGTNGGVSWGDGSSRRHREAARRTTVTLLQRKSGRGLSVTDFTASEWCEKQVEFTLNRGKPEQTPAMKAGSARHVELEKEVVTRVEIEIYTREDTWAVRLLNFIGGARQLLSEGLTRELPV